MIIEIYGKSQCQYCDMAVMKAQAMVQENDHTYTYKKLGVDFTKEELLEKFPSAKTFPQITIDGNPIGGWNEFKKV